LLREDESMPEYPPPTGERTSRTIPQDVRIAVAVRDGGKCRQCGSTEDLHFDHVIAWAKGGANTIKNVQLLCGPCNRKKGDDDIPVDPELLPKPPPPPPVSQRSALPPGRYARCPQCWRVTPVYQQADGRCVEEDGTLHVCQPRRVRSRDQRFFS
jgi:HNH endonuclease